MTGLISQIIDVCIWSFCLYFACLCRVGNNKGDGGSNTENRGSLIR